MKTRFIVAIGALTLIASSLFAANLGKYKDWPNSPQGYFLTKAERAEWSKVTSETDAEQFINKFIASRGPGFADEVAAAAKAADDHLSVAGKMGSRTLRGKIVIVLGPPSNFTIAQRKNTNRSATVSGAMNAGSGGGGRGGGGGAIGITPADMADAATSSEMSVKFFNDYTLTYTKEKLPASAGKDQVIVIEVNPSTGDDRIVDTRSARQVNELLEAAIEARAAGQPKPAQ